MPNDKTGEEGDQHLSIFVSGDFYPIGIRYKTQPTVDTAKSIFGSLFEVIQKADLAVTNLECPLTVSEKAIEKIGLNLKAHPDMALILKTAGFDLVTLANNHIFDYGQVGIVDTFKILQDNGLAYTGAGIDLKEAQSPFFFKKNGVKVAIVNIAEVEFSCADSDHGGANPMDTIDNYHQIRCAKKKCDHVIVIVHGGHEHYHYPSPKTLKRYRFYVVSGASIVIAHHTHCIGGYELYQGAPIFFSIGNFFFPPIVKKMPPSWYEGYALQLKVKKEALSFEIIPYEQCKNGSLSIDQSQRNELLNKIRKINLQLMDETFINTQWQEFINRKRSSYVTKITGLNKYVATILNKFGMLGFFFRKSQFNNLRQLIRCQAHREAVQGILSEYLKK